MKKGRKEGRKEGRRKCCHELIPRRCDVHSISGAPCNSIQNKWERWTGLNESEDKGNARSRAKKTPRP
jgi:hypothetical protein